MPAAFIEDNFYASLDCFFGEKFNGLFKKDQYKQT